MLKDDSEQYELDNGNHPSSALFRREEEHKEDGRRSKKASNIIKVPIIGSLISLGLGVAIGFLLSKLQKQNKN
jgi:hypothetical protein